MSKKILLAIALFLLIGIAFLFYYINKSEEFVMVEIGLSEREDGVEPVYYGNDIESEFFLITPNPLEVIIEDIPDYSCGYKDVERDGIFYCLNRLEKALGFAPTDDGLPENDITLVKVSTETDEGVASVSARFEYYVCDGNVVCEESQSEYKYKENEYIIDFLSSAVHKP